MMEEGMSQPAPDYVSRRQRGQEFTDELGKRRRTLSLDRAKDGPAGFEPKYIEPGFAKVENEMAPDDPEPLTPRDAQLAKIRELVAGFSVFDQDVYYRTFGPPRMSARDIAAEMHDTVSYKTVQRAVTRIKDAVAKELGVNLPGEDTTT